MTPYRGLPSTITTLRSVAAILRAPDGRYLLQHRERKPEIDYPGGWSLFGGRIEPDEAPIESIRRELIEEIGFAPPELTYFTVLTWDMGIYGDGINERWVFSAEIGARPEAVIRLSEGQGWRCFTIDELEAGVPVIPNDLFALHLFERRFEHPSVRGISAAS